MLVGYSSLLSIYTKSTKMKSFYSTFPFYTPRIFYSLQIEWPDCCYEFQSHTLDHHHRHPSTSESENSFQDYSFASLQCIYASGGLLLLANRRRNLRYLYGSLFEYPARRVPATSTIVFFVSRKRGRWQKQRTLICGGERGRTVAAVEDYLLLIQAAEDMASINKMPRA